MDNPHEKAQATREANLAARTVWYEEQAAAKRAARLTLQRVTESQDATPAELLEAAKLLSEGNIIGRTGAAWKGCPGLFLCPVSGRGDRHTPVHAARRTRAVWGPL